MKVNKAGTMRVDVNVEIWTRPASRWRPTKGNWRLEAETHNLITTAGKTLAALWAANSEPVGLTYVEIGSGTAAPTVADIALDTSFHRNAITYVIPVANIVQFRTFFTAAESTVFIKEIGIFGGTAAGAGAGTGSMLARALISLDNSGATKDVNIIWQLTVSAG